MSWHTIVSFFDFRAAFKRVVFFALIVQDTDPDTPVLLYQSSGIFMRPCDNDDEAQQIQYTGSQTIPGMLQTPQGLCISGKCTDPLTNCAPLQLIPCDASNQDLYFQYQSANNSIRSVSTDRCLSLWAGDGPIVGTTQCDNSDTQLWQIDGLAIESLSLGAYCVATNSPQLQSSLIMFDEFGNGELTIYGEFVTDHCIGVCVVNDSP
jgi:hypothetical protein